MKVIITKTCLGSITGIDTTEFKEGEIYDTEKNQISEYLCDVFIRRMKTAKTYREEIKKVEYEKKLIKPKQNKKKK